MFVSDHATDNSGIVFDLVVEPPGWEQFDYYEFYGEPYEVNSKCKRGFQMLYVDYLLIECFLV